MDLFIQRPDFSECLTKDNVSLDEALKIFEEHDWQSEIALFNKLINAKEDHCPAHFGLRSDSDSFLSVSFYQDKEYFMNYEYKSKLTIFGITLPFKITRSKSLSTEGGVKEIIAVIKLHFANNTEEILKGCQ